MYSRYELLICAQLVDLKVKSGTNYVLFFISTSERIHGKVLYLQRRQSHGWNA